MSQFEDQKQAQQIEICFDEYAAQSAKEHHDLMSIFNKNYQKTIEIPSKQSSFTALNQIKNLNTKYNRTQANEDGKDSKDSQIYYCNPKMKQGFVSKQKRTLNDLAKTDQAEVIRKSKKQPRQPVQSVASKLLQSFYGIGLFQGESKSKYVDDGYQESDEEFQDYLQQNSSFENDNYSFGSNDDQVYVEEQKEVEYQSSDEDDLIPLRQSARSSILLSVNEESKALEIQVSELSPEAKKQNQRLKILELVSQIKSQESKMSYLNKNIEFHVKINQEYDEMLLDIKSQIQEKEKDKVSKKRASNERLSQARQIYNDQIRNIEYFLSSLCSMGLYNIEQYERFNLYEPDRFQLDLTHYSPHNPNVYLSIHTRLISKEVFLQIQLQDKNIIQRNNPDQSQNTEQQPVIDIQELEERKDLSIIGLQFQEIQNDNDANFSANIFDEIKGLEKIIESHKPLYTRPVYGWLLDEEEESKNQEYFFDSGPQCHRLIKQVIKEFGLIKY
ncbi:UNKNOWN [Stylonychia lemnae]|uniref:Uncharacterized protein n=1 Tax=Stylonychia lemnae TaxID=5949 RepID=A0A078B3E8_STYLE|nr:UNKNOWN [Stylonychia lemnae]|eukprot:CDW88781.1 UNKNOWN [Stylonychia lemnae]